MFYFVQENDTIYLYGKMMRYADVAKFIDFTSELKRISYYNINDKNYNGKFFNDYSRLAMQKN
jgi:hypothetical protein